jgi:predicted nucleic acid-binding protein
MILYFDTSSIVKIFSQEVGSQIVKKLILDTTNEVYVLDLSLVELLSAVYRKLRNNEFSKENLEGIQNAIEEQFDFFNVIPLSQNMVAESKILIKNFGKDFGLRTLDALHIAGWSEVASDNWIFVTSDKNQLNVVNEMKKNTMFI